MASLWSFFFFSTSQDQICFTTIQFEKYEVSGSAATHVADLGTAQ